MRDDNTSRSNRESSSKSGRSGEHSLAQAAQQLLDESSYWHLRSIRCEVDGKAVTIRGRVPSYYLKQIAQWLVGRVEGVEKIVNLVEVVGPDTWHRVGSTDLPTAPS